MTKDKELVPFQYQAPALVDETLDVLQKIRRKLSRKTPKEIIKTRPGPINKKTGRRVMFAYVQPGYVMQQLNSAFGPAWTWEREEVDIKSVQRKNKEAFEVIFHGVLITPFGRQAGVGGHEYYPDNAEQGYADAEQAASSKALKRAAARIGVALDLYFADAEFEEVADAAEDNKAAWRAALAHYGLTEKGAIQMLSHHLTQDMNALTSFEEISEAVEGDAIDVVEVLRVQVAEAEAGIEIEAVTEGEYREVPA